jgi:hypothetical protein
VAAIVPDSASSASPILNLALRSPFAAERPSTVPRPQPFPSLRRGMAIMSDIALISVQSALIMCLARTSIGNVKYLNNVIFTAYTLLWTSRSHTHRKLRPIS